MVRESSEELSSVSASPPPDHNNRKNIHHETKAPVGTTRELDKKDDSELSELTDEEDNSKATSSQRKKRHHHQPSSPTSAKRPGRRKRSTLLPGDMWGWASKPTPNGPGAEAQKGQSQQEANAAIDGVLTAVDYTRDIHGDGDREDGIENGKDVDMEDEPSQGVQERGSTHPPVPAPVAERPSPDNEEREEGELDDDPDTGTLDGDVNDDDDNDGDNGIDEETASLTLEDDRTSVLPKGSEQPTAEPELAELPERRRVISRSPSFNEDSSRSPSPQPPPVDDEDLPNEEQAAADPGEDEEEDEPGDREFANSPSPQPKENNEAPPDSETPPAVTEVDQEQDQDLDHEGQDPDLEVELDLQPAHRAEALDVLAGIEIKFALLRERLYVEKMESLAWEEALVHQGSHPELIHLHRELVKRRDKRIELATRRQGYETTNVAKKRRYDEDLVWNTWKHARDTLQTEMISETNRKRRKLERDRRMMERPPPKRTIPNFPLEVPEPPTLHKIVHSFPFEGNDDLEEERPDTPQSPENLVYPELSTLSPNEITQDLDRIFNQPSVYDPHSTRFPHPFNDTLPALPLSISGPPPPGFEQAPPEQRNGQNRIATFPPHSSQSQGGLPPAGSGIPPGPQFPPPPSNLSNRPSQYPNSALFAHGAHILFGTEPEMSTMVNEGLHRIQSPPSHQGSGYPSQPPYGFPGHGPRSPSPQRGHPPWNGQPPAHHHGYHAMPKHDWRDDPIAPEDEERMMRDRERNRRLRDMDFPPQPPPSSRHPTYPPASNHPSVPNPRANHHHHHHVHHHHGHGNHSRDHREHEPPSRLHTTHVEQKIGHGSSGVPAWAENEAREGRLKYGLRPGSGQSPSLEAIPFALQPSSSSSYNGTTSHANDKHPSRSGWPEDSSFRRPTPSSFPSSPGTFPPHSERHSHSPTHRYNSSSQQAFPAGRPPASQRPMSIGLSPRMLPSEPPGSSHSYPPPSSTPAPPPPPPPPPPPSHSSSSRGHGKPPTPSQSFSHSPSSSSLPSGNSKLYSQLNGPGGQPIDPPMSHLSGPYNSFGKSRSSDVHDRDRDRPVGNGSNGPSVMSVPSILDGR